MTERRQGKFELIDGGAGEIKPPEAQRPMRRWQWALLWVGSIAIWILLFFYCWQALQEIVRKLTS